MRKTFHTYLILAFFLPFVASAQGIVSETSSESDTGGNTVGGGGTTTSGDSSASVHTTTIKDGSSGSSTVEIKIETKTDGEVYTETIKKEVKDGEEVRVSTSSTSNKGTTSKGKVRVSAEASVTGKTIQSNIASSTFWSRIPFWKSFIQVATTSEVERPEKVGRVLPHATTSPLTGIKTLFQKIFSVIIFWR